MGRARLLVLEGGGGLDARCRQPSASILRVARRAATGKAEKSGAEVVAEAVQKFGSPEEAAEFFRTTDPKWSKVVAAGFGTTGEISRRNPAKPAIGTVRTNSKYRPRYFDTDRRKTLYYDPSVVVATEGSVAAADVDLPVARRMADDGFSRAWEMISLSHVAKVDEAARLRGELKAVSDERDRLWRQLHPTG